MSELDEEKLFYERFYSLHRDRDLVRVYEVFGIGVFRRSSVLEGFDAFVKAHGFGGKRCVEIGTCNGLTAAVLARYFGEVVSIDVEPNDKKRQILAYLGIENVRLVDVKDNAEKGAVIAELGEFDAGFSDGDHARDTDSDFALLEPCGRVLFHEYWRAQPPVWMLVNALRATGKVETEKKWALWTRT